VRCVGGGAAAAGLHVPLFNLFTRRLSRPGCGNRVNEPQRKEQSMNCPRWAELMLVI
jgi:hypothetical protein